VGVPGGKSAKRIGPDHLRVRVCLRLLHLGPRNILPLPGATNGVGISAIQSSTQPMKPTDSIRLPSFPPQAQTPTTGFNLGFKGTVGNALLKIDHSWKQCGQHGHVQHVPYSNPDDHRMMHSNSAQSFASPRMGPVPMAYPPAVNPQGQVPYGQPMMQPSMNAAPQIGQFRGFSHNPQDRRRVGGSRGDNV
jgi:hypothetical protein